MIKSNQLFSFFIFTAALSDLWLCYLVFVKGTKKPADILFSVICFFVSAWCLGYGLLSLGGNPGLMTTGIRVIFLSSLILPLLLLSYSLFFYEDKDAPPASAVLLLSIPALILLILLPGGLLINTPAINSNSIKIIPGNGYYFFMLYSISYLWAAGSKLISRYRSIVFLCAALGLSLFMPFFGLSRFFYFYPLLSLILPASAVYSIIKYRNSRRAVEYHKVIKDVSQIISSITDLNKIFRLIDRSIIQAMSVKNIAILLLEERENCFKLEKTGGNQPLLGELKLPLDCGLARSLEEKKDALLIKNSEMEAFEAVVAIPSFTRGKLVGIFLLGEKLSGEGYSPDDIELLNTLASEAGIAIENAKLYRDITETRDYLNSLVNSSHDAIITMNREGIILSWNKGAENIFGYAANEMIGKIQVIFAEEEIQALINRVINSEPVKALEIKKKNKAGEEIPLLLTLAPILDPLSKTIGISAILTDITELRKVDKLKQELLSSVSQGLRAPLAPIKESLALVLNDDTEKLSPKHREALIRTLAEASHLDNLIDSLIDISRIEAGKPLELKKAPVYLDELIKESAANYQPSLQSKNINLQMDFPAHRIALMADKNKLLHALDNLLENARKFTPKGGAVNILMSIEENRIKIRISDTGMGIAADKLDKIFDKFYQVDTSYSHLSGGIGMGLTIAKEIIEAHEGRIWAESEGMGKGASFIFTLPLIA